MNISGHTKPFAVLGHPIGHTLSPVMHNAAFRELGMDAIYLALNVKPEALLTVLASMKDMGFGGVNLTIPLKEVAFNGLDELDESAQLLGAVNTVEFTDDGLVGHNTDGAGFLTAVEEAFGQGVTGQHVLVLGAGGAGRAVALASARGGARSLSLSDVDIERAERVSAEITGLGSDVSSSVVLTDGVAEEATKADLIVQATPVGMNTDDVSLLGPEAFHEGQHVFDLIYMFPETATLRTARENGARVANGLGMLLHQGARAFSIWTGQDAPVQAMRNALEKAVYEA